MSLTQQNSRAYPEELPRPVRAGRRQAVTVACGLLVWLALVLPDQPALLAPLGFLRIPVEALLLVLLAVLLPPRALRIVAPALGALLGLFVLLKALDLGFGAAFDRPFDVVNDWYYFGPAVGVLTDQIGRAWAVLAVIGIVVLAVALLVAMPPATVRVAGALASHRRRSVTVLAAGGVIWVGSLLSGAAFAAGAPVAMSDTSRLAWDTVGSLRSDIADGGTFTADIHTDPYAAVPGDRLLTGLRGKDVLLVFVESYGRVALDDPQLAPTVRAALSGGQDQLTSAGFAARSAYLTSATFGGASWLAHSSVQSGLWVDSQQRYDQLVAGQRLTLTRAFAKAGWRTVFDVPATTRPWPEGRPFYGFDMLYTAGNVGYRGPTFGYATMPDQYILQAFRERELTPGHRPVMAEIDLLSSHYPWTPPPPLLPWDRVGDGSGFASPPSGGGGPGVYAQAIAYSLRAVSSFVATSDDPNLVLLVMGDHQPNTSVTGPGASHQVPVMLIAHDPTVLKRTAGWGWTPGLTPAPDAPVWRMDAVRDRLLSTF